MKLCNNMKTTFLGMVFLLLSASFKLISMCDAHKPSRVSASVTSMSAKNITDNTKSEKVTDSRKRKRASKESINKDSPWWKGLHLGDKKSGWVKEATATMPTEQQQEEEDHEAVFSADEILCPLQLEPLLQVPCLIQMILDEACFSSSGANKRFARSISTTASSSKSSSQQQPQHPVQAFIDTGAQRTVMTWEAARRLGIAHLIDRRYEGQATGVGLCRVLGRIPAHTVRLQFRGLDAAPLVVTAPSITVLETTGTPGVELLLGLDFLRDNNAVIDLNEGELQLVNKNRGNLSTSGTKKEEGSTDPREIIYARIPFIQPRNGAPLDAGIMENCRNEKTKRDEKNDKSLQADENEDDNEDEDEHWSEYESDHSDEEIDMSWL